MNFSPDACVKKEKRRKTQHKTMFRMTREQFGPAEVVLYGIAQQEMSMFDCMSTWQVTFFSLCDFCNMQFAMLHC